MATLCASIVIAASAAGCTTDEYLQKVTAPLTKCNAANLQISDIVLDEPTTWRAICQSDGKIYQCSKATCTEVE